MAQKPDGKPARTERVTFTRPAAERIAKVVREVEAGDRDQAGLTFGNRVTGPSGKAFRVATFTGSWSINGEKTVTFRNQTTTPNTVAAVNLFLNLPDNGQRNCAIAKDGTAWHLIQWQWDASTALSSATLGGSLEFGRINVPSLGTASTVSIAVTTCSTAAT
jgi:triacylglycerol esterase/lipase EstA (alpha/beta hydrolase family)